MQLTFCQIFCSLEGALKVEEVGEWKQPGGGGGRKERARKRGGGGDDDTKEGTELKQGNHVPGLESLPFSLYLMKYLINSVVTYLKHLSSSPFHLRPLLIQTLISRNIKKGEKASKQSWH